MPDSTLAGPIGETGQVYAILNRDDAVLVPWQAPRGAFGFVKAKEARRDKIWPITPQIRQKPVCPKPFEQASLRGEACTGFCADIADVPQLLKVLALDRAAKPAASELFAFWNVVHGSPFRRCSRLAQA